MDERFTLEYHWEGDSLRFKRSGIDGHLDVSDSEVAIKIRLEMLMLALKPVLEKEVHRYMDEALEKTQLRRHTMFSRRDFIKASAASAATLAALRMGCVWAADPDVIADPDHTYHSLTEQDRSLLTVLTPIILAEALPSDEGEAKLAIKEVVRGIDMSVTLLPAGAQAEMRQFFDLLENQLLPDWKDPTKVEQFLWQSQAGEDPSPEAQALQVGMTGLMQLTLASWYANPRSWTATGYAGPPVLY